MNFLEGNIVCPYFKYLKSCKIKCESVNDFSKIFSIEFVNNSTRNEYIKNFCSCGCYRGCAVAEIIERIYDD